MTAQVRKTGLGVLGDMPWGTHCCHFYQTQKELLETLVPYFKAGLKNREFCLARPGAPDRGEGPECTAPASAQR
jgi:MEDS: MEthanogen/methylotroph, DcmR Sensory domain